MKKKRKKKKTFKNFRKKILKNKFNFFTDKNFKRLKINDIRLIGKKKKILLFIENLTI